MRLRDIARPEYDGVEAGLRKQGGFRPEIDGMADGKFQAVGKITGLQTTLFGLCGIACRQRWPGKGDFIIDARRQCGKGRMQCGGRLRRQRPEAETQLGGGGDHIGFDATFDLADIERHAGQTAEPVMGLAGGQIEGGIAPAQGLMHRTLHRVADFRSMPGSAGETHHGGADAPVRQHGLTAGGFGHDHIGKPVIVGEEGRDATRVIGFLVTGKKKCGIARSHFGRGQQRGRRTFDVTGAQTDGAVAVDGEYVRVLAPARSHRHRIQMHIEQGAGLAANGEKRDCTGAVVGDSAGKSRQVALQIIENAAGPDPAWRILGVERHQGLQMRQGPVQQSLTHVRSPLTLAHRFELMPNKRMKPSASVAPQSADCA